MPVSYLQTGTEASTADKAVTPHTNSYKCLSLCHSALPLSYKYNLPYIFNNRAHWPAVLLILARAHYKVKLSLTLMLTCTCKLKHKLKNEVQLLWKFKARFLSPSDFVMTNIRCHLRLVLSKDLIHNHNVGH